MIKIIRVNNTFSIYNNESLLYVLRRSNTTFYSYCSLYENDKLLFKYYYASFFCYIKVKILFQDLLEKISVKSKFSSFDFIVEDSLYHSNITISPFSRKVGKLYLDNEIIANIERSSKGVNDEYQVDFIKKIKDITFPLICLLINLTDADGGL